MSGARELVRLPVALSWLERPVAGPDPRPGRGERTVHLYVVERVLGHAWMLSSDRSGEAALEVPVTPADPAALAGDDGGAVLPARLGLDDCRKRIEAMASRSAFILGRGRMIDVTALATPRPAGYPFWVSYRRDPRGRIDFDAADAVTGRRAGGALRSAIASALIDADRAL